MHQVLDYFVLGSVRGVHQVLDYFVLGSVRGGHQVLDYFVLGSVWGVHQVLDYFVLGSVRGGRQVLDYFVLGSVWGGHQVHGRGDETDGRGCSSRQTSKISIDNFYILKINSYINNEIADIYFMILALLEMDTKGISCSISGAQIEKLGIHF